MCMCMYVLGAAANVMTTPIEAIRASYTVSRTGTTSLTACVRTMLHQYGPVAFVRGFMPTTLWAFTYIGQSGCLNVCHGFHL